MDIVRRVIPPSPKALIELVSFISMNPCRSVHFTRVTAQTDLEHGAQASMEENDSWDVEVTGGPGAMFPPSFRKRRRKGEVTIAACTCSAVTALMCPQASVRQMRVSAEVKRIVNQALITGRCLSWLHSHTFPSIPLWDSAPITVPCHLCRRVGDRGLTAAKGLRMGQAGGLLVVDVTCR